MIRAVFFDLDDTLCDTIGTREARARLAWQAIIAERPDVDFEPFLRRVMEPTGDRITRGVRAVIAELGLAESERGRKASDIWFFDGCIDLLRALPGVVDTLGSLRHQYRLGIITNGDGKLQRVKWLRLNLGIDLVVISAECGFEKPDARIFNHALALAGVGAGEAVFVGDRLDVDIAGAQAAGIRAVWFNHWGGSLDGSPVTPDAVIKRFSDLPNALAALADS